jgi:hypothetical protein
MHYSNVVFDDIESMNYYNHHDYFLLNLPLCLEWLDFSPGAIETHERDVSRVCDVSCCCRS